MSPRGLPKIEIQYQQKPCNRDKKCMVQVLVEEFSPGLKTASQK